VCSLIENVSDKIYGTVSGCWAVGGSVRRESLFFFNAYPSLYGVSTQLNRCSEHQSLCTVSLIFHNINHCSDCQSSFIIAIIVLSTMHCSEYQSLCWVSLCLLLLFRTLFIFLSISHSSEYKLIIVQSIHHC